jgi:predicted nuclease of predicted toxin-antitoxin system
VLAFLADENFHNGIVDGLRRRSPDLELVRVQDVGLLAADDPVILTWAAQTERVLLTHDVATVPHFANERVAVGLPMPGVFLVPDTMPIGQAIEEILLLAQCSREREWEGQVLYLPL